MSASLVNDVGSTIVIGDEPGRMLPPAAGIVAQAVSASQAEYVEKKCNAAPQRNEQEVQRLCLLLESRKEPLDKRPRESLSVYVPESTPECAPELTDVRRKLWYPEI